MSLSFSTTVTFHHVILEAAPSGTDDWTTLPDTRGGTTKAPPSPCPADVLATHPFLLHYLTPGLPCAPRGTTGEWNAFNGESGGWRNVSFDLSRYAGRPVDVKVSYVANTVVGAKNGIGVFVDDTRVTTTAGVLDADGFEGDTSSWTVEDPPPGSPPASRSNFVISTELVGVAASVITRDTVLFGYGIEAPGDAGGASRRPRPGDRAPARLTGECRACRAETAGAWRVPGRVRARRTGASRCRTCSCRGHIWAAMSPSAARWASRAAAGERRIAATTIAPVPPSLRRPTRSSPISTKPPH
jgi:hypothetical protein